MSNTSGSTLRISADPRRRRDCAVRGTLYREGQINARALCARDDLTEIAGRCADTSCELALRDPMLRKVCGNLGHDAMFAHREPSRKRKFAMCDLLKPPHRAKVRYESPA